MNRTFKRVISSVLAFVMVMSCMIVMNVSTALAAASYDSSCAYAEWEFGSSKAPAADKLNGSDFFKTNGATLTEKPALASTGTKFSTKQIKSGSAGSGFNWKGIAGQDYSIPADAEIGSTSFYGIKLEKNTEKNEITELTITTNLESNGNFSSYDLFLVHGIVGTGEREIEVKGFNGTSDSDGTIIPTNKTANEKNATVSSEVKELTYSTIKIQRTGSESALFYIGLKYNPAKGDSYTITGSTNLPDGATFDLVNGDTKFSSVVASGNYTATTKAETAPVEGTYEVKNLANAIDVEKGKTYSLPEGLNCTVGTFTEFSATGSALNFTESTLKCEVTVDNENAKGTLAVTTDDGSDISTGTEVDVNKELTVNVTNIEDGYTAIILINGEKVENGSKLTVTYGKANSIKVVYRKYVEINPTIEGNVTTYDFTKVTTGTDEQLPYDESGDSAYTSFKSPDCYVTTSSKGALLVDNDSNAAANLDVPYSANSGKIRVHGYITPATNNAGSKWALVDFGVVYVAYNGDSSLSLTNDTQSKGGTNAGKLVKDQVVEYEVILDFDAKTASGTITNGTAAPVEFKDVPFIKEKTMSFIQFTTNGSGTGSSARQLLIPSVEIEDLDGPTYDSVTSTIKDGEDVYYVAVIPEADVKDTNNVSYTLQKNGADVKYADGDAVVTDNVVYTGVQIGNSVFKVGEVGFVDSGNYIVTFKLNADDGTGTSGIKDALALKMNTKA